MKKIFGLSVALHCVFLCCLVQAGGIPTMQLTWATDTTDIEQFKLYYATSSDMTNKIWHQECDGATEQPAGTGIYTMKCTNIPIAVFPAYIQMAMKVKNQSDEITSNIQKISSYPIPPNIINITIQ